MAGLKDVIESKLPDFAKIVGASAPLLASVLGTPLAGVAISLLANAFGVKSHDLDNISAVITADPESSIKIKTVEYEHAETLANIAAQNYSTEVDDRKDARNHAETYKDFMMRMSVVVTVGFFLVLILSFVPINLSPESRSLLSMLVGMLASKWQTIIDFFYGSSHLNSQGGTK